jgi:very-short-patch-repair endonuclease
MSVPEVLLWQRLRRGQGGARFRRQHPIGDYVTDFYCAAARLVIEVDGAVHADAARMERDRIRDKFMADKGYNVVRILTADILRDVDQVAAAIVALAASPLHHQPAAGGPPPRSGEDFL